MNQRPKKTIPNVLRQMHHRRSQFKVCAVTSQDPEQFAENMQSTLNSLVSDGWNITGMMERAGSLIITAQKHDSSPIVGERVQHVPSPSSEKTEVTYYFIENGVLKNVPCSSMVEAIHRVRDHIGLEEADVLPVRITQVSVIDHEPLKDLEYLESTYLSPDGG